jgi:hypothetical protein
MRAAQRIRKFASWSGVGGSREPAGAPLQRIEANHAPTSLIGWQSQVAGKVNRQSTSDWRVGASDDFG